MPGYVVKDYSKNEEKKKNKIIITIIHKLLIEETHKKYCFISSDVNVISVKHLRFHSTLKKKTENTHSVFINNSKT